MEGANDIAGVIVPNSADQIGCSIGLHDTHPYGTGIRYRFRCTVSRVKA